MLIELLSRSKCRCINLQMHIYFFCPNMLFNYPLSFPTRSTYSCIAVSLDFPFNSSHAVYFAFATKSKGLEGASTFTSPSVDCLYNEYNCSSTSLEGFSGRDLLLATAASNCYFSSIDFFQK